MYNEQEGTYTIKCPYCFCEFPQEHTIFRAHTAFDRTQLDLEDDDDMGTGLLGRGKGAQKPKTDTKELFLRFDAEENGKKLDHKLIEYWKKRGGSAGYAEYDKTWANPHIDPQSDSFADMICFEPQGADRPGPDGFVRDSDGFIMRVLDKFDPTPQPMERLCPDCHNPMPLADYGKYPVLLISVVGITGAGKTVYLNQLLTRFAAEIHKDDYILTTNNLHTIGETVNPGCPLPGATDDKIMRRPLAATLLKRNAGSSEGLTLVFYDIAGENCVNKDHNRDEERAKATIGNFIAYCDAMIVLLDPEQIPTFATGALQPSILSNVVTVMSSIRANFNTESPDWRDTPVAVCLAKSDKLNNHPDIVRACPELLSSSKRNAPGFADLEEHQQIDAFLRGYLDQNASVTVSSLSTFTRSSFFAVSAITCGVSNRFEKYENQYILDEYNDRLFRHLHSWVEGWNERQPENRSFYHNCPVKKRDGSPIVLPETERFTQENSGFETEIQAATTFGDVIHLTLWDVYAGVQLVGYPIADPNPRRIGEPLRWILWKLRKIGPYYCPDPMPERKFWQSQKKYDEICEAYQLEQWQREILFYGDELE